MGGNYNTTDHAAIVAAVQVIFLCDYHDMGVLRIQRLLGSISTCISVVDCGISATFGVVGYSSTLAANGLSYSWPIGSLAETVVVESHRHRSLALLRP